MSDYDCYAISHNLLSWFARVKMNAHWFLSLWKMLRLISDSIFFKGIFLELCFFQASFRIFKSLFTFFLLQQFIGTRARMRAVSIKTVILISLGRNSSDSEINTSDYLVTDFFPTFLLLLLLNCGEMHCLNCVKCITMPLELFWLTYLYGFFYIGTAVTLVLYLLHYISLGWPKACVF